MCSAQRVGVMAEAPADGVRVGGQNVKDTDSGVRRRSHLVIFQGHGPTLY